MRSSATARIRSDNTLELLFRLDVEEGVHYLENSVFSTEFSSQAASRASRPGVYGHFGSPGLPDCCAR